MTSPPCEEYVVHFVVEKTIETSTTLISMLRDGLEYPEDSAVLKEHQKIIDGTNRFTQPLNQRQVMYFDRSKSCTPYRP